jgi:ribosomal protein S18 acetylase RimI-like enzyme
MINEDLARAHAFAHRIDARTSTDVIPIQGGHAYLDREYLGRYMSSFLFIEDAGATPAERWIEEADRILGGAGCRHRTVTFADPADVERLSMTFLEHGYTVDGGVLLVQREEPERSHDVVTVEEVTFEELRPLLVTSYRRDPWASDEATVQALVDYRGKLERAIGARFFMTRVEGEPAGYCELYVDGDDAQVESVDTLEEFRSRGLASAAVLRAAAEGRAAGASWVFLWADDDDWPQHWYARLGFRQAARTAEFLRWPTGEGPSAKSPAGP